MHDTNDSPDPWLAALVDELAGGGLVLRDDFLPAETLAALRAEALARHAAGEFGPAGIGSGDRHHRDTRIRGDHTRWLDDDSAAQRAYTARIAALQQAINRSLFLGLRRHEAHFAVFEPGTGYGRHLDSFRGNNARVVTTVLYLNEAWDAGWGGELAVFDGDGDPHDTANPQRLVAPRPGRFVCFLSERLPHAVLPATRRRFSIAGWFRRDDAP